MNLCAKRVVCASWWGQVLNLPVVRQFLFQQGDLPPPLLGNGRTGGGAAALAPPPMLAVTPGPGQLEEDDED